MDLLKLNGGLNEFHLVAFQPYFKMNSADEYRDLYYSCNICSLTYNMYFVKRKLILIFTCMFVISLVTHQYLSNTG